jgi:phosphohistidine phosphatase SixA
LTRLGTEEAGLAGAYCKRQGLRPDLILTSPYARTVQTGGIVAAAIGDIPVQEDAFLASGMEPEQAFEGLRSYRQFECLMIVGHQPDLGLMTAALLGAREGANLPFRLATLAGVRVERLAFYGGSLEFFVPLSLMQERNDS